ncbi:rhomboid family intramembrane serine protease, partial [Staphylococcus argenteus]
MNIDKQFWKTIYYWIRYLNFDIVSREKDDQEIWLAHKRKKQIVIFKQHINSTQEMRFDKAKVLDHKKEIAEFISFEPQSFEFYYFTEASFSEEQLNEVAPIKIKFNIIRNTNDLIKQMPNFILAKMISEDND